MKSMKSRIPWTLLATLMIVVAVALTVTRGQESESQAPTSRPADNARQLPLDPGQEDAMTEILRIRQRQGNLLAGSIFADLPEDPEDGQGVIGDADRFAQALQRVIERQSTAALLGESATRRCEAAYARATDQQSSADQDSPYCRSLRRSARLLDRRANDLEDQLLFAEADRLRELAHQLRAEARTSPPVRTARGD